jgi:pilus assembly protein CpaC
MKNMSQAFLRSFCLALAVSLVAQVALAQNRPPATETREMSLSIGENQLIPAENVKSYSEGNEGVVEVRLTPEGNGFVVVGKKPGQSTLLLLLRNGKQILYTIDVFPRPMEAVEREISQLLADDTGLRIRRVGPRMYIEGGVSTEPELKRIEHIAKLYPNQVESLVVLGGGAAQRKHNIRLDILFIQFNKTNGWQVGLKLPPSINPISLTGQYSFLAPAGFTQATAQIVEQPLVGLDLAQNKGFARVLKHSTIITANGAEAQFSSGAEQNYRIGSGLVVDLRALNFGTDVKVLPRFDPVTRELGVKVTADISDLTASVAPGSDLPGRNVTKLNTQVTLKIGQALVLSGIHTKSMRKGSSGLPGLSAIPILGMLFGSQNAYDDEVEGAVYLLPSVVEVIPKRQKDLVNELVDTYEKNSLTGAIDGRMPEFPEVK